MTIQRPPSSDGFQTLRWREERLELIDQRALPGRVDYHVCHTAADVARAIRDMIVRGAPAIGCAAAYGIALEAARLRDAAPADFLAALDRACDALAASRPTAVNLFWALERMRAVRSEEHTSDSSHVNPSRMPSSA